jgi:phage shock protein PspC (stress-responsive transcriptional regulator)
MIAVRYDMEIGLVRFMAVLLALSSFGLALVLYIGLYFFLPKVADSFSSMNSTRRF